MKLNTLSEWNKLFDKEMNPLVRPERRGKSGKVTSDIVRQIIEVAEKVLEKKKYIHLKLFIQLLRDEHKIELSEKTIAEILIANDLYQPSTRKRQPTYYQSLKQNIPNSLISLDGSEFKVIMGEDIHKFNVELATDVKTFHHDAHETTDTEVSECVIDVVEKRKTSWGTPLGVLIDCGTANLSGETITYFKENNIEWVPVGPGNPKGNGTDEGAFSQMKKVIGQIVLDTSSSRALAKSVLNKIIEVYITMRNRTPRVGENLTPDQAIAREITTEERELHRKRYQEMRRETEDPSRQEKRERLDWIIKHHGLEVDQYALDRAYKCIIAYDLKAINQSEEAFIVAIRRDMRRCKLPYYFGILKRIQKDLDDAAYQKYCRNRYHYVEMLKQEMLSKERGEETITVEDLAQMLKAVVTAGPRFIKDYCLRQVESLVQQLQKQYKYIGALKSKISEALGEIGALSFEQRKEAFQLVESYLV